MTIGATASSGVEYDVYISFPRAESAWASRLSRDLQRVSVRTFVDLEAIRPGQDWNEASRSALARSSVLVVVWSRAAETSTFILSEIAEFEALTRHESDRRLVIPVVLGGNDILRAAPSPVSSRQALIIGPETYTAGAEAESEEWSRAVAQIFSSVAAQSRPDADHEHMLGEPATLPSFSSTALKALTFAAEMLADDKSAEPARFRTAALLGALLASAKGGMTPTTGDVVRFVLDRQRDGRNAEEAIGAAAVAAGLRHSGYGDVSPLSLRELSRSNVNQLVSDAAEMQRRTGADGVHLRHVLASGVDPAVPSDALAELGISMRELREEWRASIARTWPAESQEGWDDILLERLVKEGFPGGPPSARVHADRWTTEDRLDYALYARAIAEFIRHPDAKPPMVISVQAPWGQGKTSLMRMVQRDLDPGHPDFRGPERGSDNAAEFEPPSELTFGELRDSLDGRVTIVGHRPMAIRTVWFNAWKYQNSEEVWAGLAHAILAQLPARLSPRDREFFWLRLQLRRIDPTLVREDIHRAAIERFLPRLAGWAALALGALIVLGVAVLAGGYHAAGVAISGGGLLGAAWVARRAWAAATREVLGRRLEGAYLRYVRQPDYASKLGYLHLVEEDMGRALDLLTPDDQPAVIFIDDLDRCSPAKIGEVIEAMNLFLAGDYPNCAFVMGIDAEVVAASMEVVHSHIIDKLNDRRGELGWRFMDKFVQLPFVMPRLHPDQRAAYLRGLFATPQEDETPEIVAEANSLERDAREDRLPVDELARRAGELAPRLMAIAPERARALGEQVVAAGARAFSDTDPEVIEALAAQLRYLSDNPRTIKRAVNLYRFHRFAAFARQASALPLQVATPEQIGRWVVLIVRWPQFVRWLQAQRDHLESGEEDPAVQVVTLARNASTAKGFKTALVESGVDASWADDTELWELLRAKINPELSIDLAASRGMW